MKTVRDLVSNKRKEYFKMLRDSGKTYNLKEFVEHLGIKIIEKDEIFEPYAHITKVNDKVSIVVGCPETKMRNCLILNRLGLIGQSYFDKSLLEHKSFTNRVYSAVENEDQLRYTMLGMVMACAPASATDTADAFAARYGIYPFYADMYMWFNR